MDFAFKITLNSASHLTFTKQSRHVFAKTYFGTVAFGICIQKSHINKPENLHVKSRVFVLMCPLSLPSTVFKTSAYFFAAVHKLS